ncbi:LysE/ArgO family amino acid transporter [Gracilibacillus sp. HCP3S3_G5_1]|uniref:LysE/ArgO family amino acid transporter n=1 Tax=unclassified Gracilibacillus TaxID=2625209 RepID=UPI003F8A8A0E
MLEPIIHGLILSFGLILPIGVQNVFIFNQGVLQPTFLRILPAIITASICDTVLIMVAVYGVSFILLDLVWLMNVLIVLGIIFLFYMGSVTWKAGVAASKDSEKASLSIRKQIVFALSVSMLNPHAMIDTIGVIGPSSLRYDGEEQFIFALTCITVSWVWFFGLGLLGRFSKELDKSGHFLTWLNKISAVFMWLAAILLVLSFL